MISATMLAFSLLLSAIALSDVVCTWDGTGYTCSGSGGIIQVGGGGGVLPGPDSGIVTTNGFGVCTNCSQITPAELQQLAEAVDGSAIQIGTLCDQILGECGDLRSSITSNNSELASFQGPWPITVAGGREATNYMFTVHNTQTALMLDQYNTGVPLAQKIAVARGVGNAVKSYADNYLMPQNNANLAKLSDIERDVGTVQGAAAYLRSPVAEDLAAGAVACEFALSGGGGGTNSAPSVSTGNWCTYDQGEALKSLLEELKQYANKQHAQLVAISNYTREASELLRSGLFTDYNAIPSAAGLGDWRQVYLDGAETNWGYQPTNILARIELLLYGMSGVGTNETDFTDESQVGSTDVMDDLEEHKDEAADQIRALDTDADGTGATTLGSALIAFFNAFTPQTSAHQGGEEAIPSYSYTLNGEEYYVDAIATPSNVTTLNTLRNASGTVCGAIYLVVSGWAVFAYWRWFAEKAVQLSRWAVELVTSMFGS